MVLDKKIIFGVIILVILGVAGFLYYRSTIFSKEILKLEIIGPENAKMGDEIEYTVKYKNNGDFALENPKLIFELPENSLTEDGKTRLTQDLKDSYPGAEDSVTFKARLLGKENDVKIARAIISYTPHNLSVRYESETTLTTKIESVPITLTYDMPLKVEKGKEMSYVINYFSNVDYPLENMAIKIDAIQGFSVVSASPASLDNTQWPLPLLAKGQGGRIRITGAISADAGNHLAFSAHLGMRHNGTFLPVKDITQDLEIIKPLLFVSQQINGSTSYTPAPGEVLHYELFFRNIGSTPFNNLFVISRLDGLAFDFSTLQSLEGQTKPGDNLIVFDSRQISELAHLAPNQEAKVDFVIKLKDSSELASVDKNALVVKNKVDVEGISQEFVTKINSKIELVQNGYYSNANPLVLQSGMINSGPIPPKVGVPTSYAIVWQVKNYLNDVKNIKVKASLPSNVTLGDTIFPEEQASRLSFDSQSRQVVWSIDSLNAGATTSLVFQVTLTPGISQKGMFVPLMSPATISAEDQFTGSPAQSTAPPVMTNTSDDVGNSGNGIVQ